MSELLTQANTFKRELLQGDAAALRRLSAAYALSETYLRSQLENLLREIERQRAAGQAVSRAWLLRRFEILLRQVEAEMGRLAGHANSLITGRQRELVGLGREHALSLIRAAGVEASFVKLPRGAVEEMVGNLSDGTPLSRLLNKLAPEAARAAREVLIAGIVAGEGPRAVAKRFGEATGTARWKALRIARTEGMRAYNGAAQRTYEANADVVSGWRWLAAANACRFCAEKNGTLHPVTETLHSHPNCRCTQLPEIDVTAGRMTDAPATAAAEPPQAAPAAPTFKPAKTLEEARQFAEALGVKSVDFGSKLHVANMINEGLARLKAEGFAEMPARIMPLERSSAWGRNPKATPAAYYAESDTLAINPRGGLWANGGKNAAEITRKHHDQGWWSSPDRLHVITHEMGHMLHRKAIGDRFIHMRVNPISEATKAEIGSEVSRYGLTKQVEFVAEVFAGMRAGKVYSETVMKWYRAWGGPEK
jgi:SPP1 gp7 family putative phage head morphogenesis protein